MNDHDLLNLIVCRRPNTNQIPMDSNFQHVLNCCAWKMVLYWDVIGQLLVTHNKGRGGTTLFT